MKKPKVPPRKSLNTPNYIGSKDFYNNLKKLPGLPLNKPKEDSPLVKKTKGVLAAVSRIPGMTGMYGQALSAGADLGTGIAKSFRGDKQGARKDFAQAAAGAAALSKPLRATKFVKSGNIIIDAADISEVLPTGDTRQDTRQKKKSKGSINVPIDELSKERLQPKKEPATTPLGRPIVKPFYSKGGKISKKK